ncbi:MAG: mechanosensitive ion channel domain-containing protein, partial [Bacteroidota bacterium]
MSELVEMLRIADGKVVGTVVVLAAFYLLRHIAYRIINERVEKLNRRYAWRQTVSYAIYLLVLLIIVRLWFAWFQSVWTLLSLVAAALVIISKELLLNVVASGVIAWRQLFEIGDRIQIADRAGDVIETGLMYFSVA